MGKPDWRNSEDYACMDSLKPSQWAWEFLRRNPKYIEAWERYCQAMCEISKDPNLSPVPDELVGAEEWGIANGYHDPEKDNPDIEWLPAVDSGFLMKIEDTPPTEKGHRWMGQLLPDDKGWIPIQFNIYNPIVPQIKAAKKELMRLQEEAEKRNKAVRKAFKPRRDERITLLRVLDANAEEPKPKNKEIASLLFTGIDEDNAAAGWVSDKRGQALRYVKRDYRLLPYSEK
jgi:hypothetical protein